MRSGNMPKSLFQNWQFAIEVNGFDVALFHKGQEPKPKLLMIYTVDEQGKMDRRFATVIEGTLQGPDAVFGLLAYEQPGQPCGTVPGLRQIPAGLPHGPCRRDKRDVLSKRGRYTVFRNNLQAKEVINLEDAAMPEATLKDSTWKGCIDIWPTT